MKDSKLKSLKSFKPNTQGVSLPAKVSDEKNPEI